jgi:hypothetical protein
VDCIETEMDADATHLSPASGRVQGASPARSRNRFQNQDSSIFEIPSGPALGNPCGKHVMASSRSIGRLPVGDGWSGGGRGGGMGELISLFVRTRQVPLESVR